MLVKLLFLLSSCLLVCNDNIYNGNKVGDAHNDQPTDCSKCYFIGQAYNIGSYSPSGAQKCVLGSNGKGAVWVNNNANVPAATCMYCQLAGSWYSEGALNGTNNPVTYCKSGNWVP